MKVCKKCKTENPSSATYCMKCGDLLVEEEQLTEEERLRKLLRESEAEKELLRAALKAKSNETKKERKSRTSLQDNPKEGKGKQQTNTVRDTESRPYSMEGCDFSPDNKAYIPPYEEMSPNFESKDKDANADSLLAKGCVWFIVFFLILSMMISILD